MFNNPIYFYPGISSLLLAIDTTADNYDFLMTKNKTDNTYYSYSLFKYKKLQCMKIYKM